MANGDDLFQWLIFAIFCLNLARETASFHGKRDQAVHGAEPFGWRPGADPFGQCAVSGLPRFFLEGSETNIGALGVNHNQIT